MPNRYRDDDDERNRGEYSGGPFGQRGEFGGDYARDRHRGFGGDYARDEGWSGAGRADQYTRDAHWGGTGAPGQWTTGRHGHATLGYGPGQTRSTFGNDHGYTGSAMPYGETDPAGRGGFRGRGPKNWRPSDERIRDTVNELLTDHDGIDATDVEVVVENGEVTLNGMVGSRWQKRLAEDIAHSCRGVNDVHNRLRVADRENQVGKASE
ncbi:MAG TPA: BON domain-containing protein [Thermoanaerobaculia bacterium]|jgi:osmotically-inducible protein OsmY